PGASAGALARGSRLNEDPGLCTRLSEKDPSAMALAAELLAAGQRWQQAGDLTRAEEAYRQLVAQGPGHAQAWYLLGTLRLVRGDLPAAAAGLEQALRLRPAFVEALHYRGIVFAQQGQLTEALARFREALRLKPGDLEIETNLGLALTRQGQY